MVSFLLTPNESKGEDKEGAVMIHPFEFVSTNFENGFAMRAVDQAPAFNALPGQFVESDMSVDEKDSGNVKSQLRAPKV